MATELKRINVGNGGWGNNQLILSYDIDTQNVEGNFTTITVYLNLYCPVEIRFDGAQAWLHDSGWFNISKYYSGGTYLLKRMSINIPHNIDGSGSFDIGFGIQTTFLVSGSSTGGATLPMIPRAAKITACVDFTDEDNPTISISNLGGFNLEGWLEPNPSSDHLAIRTIPTNAKTYTWVLTEAERKQLRAKCTSNQCVIRVGLYSKDKAFVDYKDVKYNIINADPTFTTASFATQNNLTLADNLTIIKGYSNIKVTLGKATAKKEATIESYKVICGSVMKTGTELTYTLENVDDSIIRCYATDSRGNTTEKIINVTKYIDYAPITANMLEYERSDGGIGKGVTITFEGNLWTGNFGKLSNTITAQYFYKKRGASTWTQGTTAINPTVLANYTKTVSIRGDLGASGFDNAYDYDIKVIVSDRLSSDEFISIISKGQPHLDFCQYGIALGGRYDESVLVSGEHDPLQIYSSNQDKMIAGAFLVTYDEATKEIKTVDGKVIGVGAFQYSMEEQWTGRYWHDGKKIYTKSFTFSFASNAYDIDVSRLAIDQLFIKFDSSTMNTSSGAIYTIPRVAMIDNTGPNQIELNLSKSKIGIACGGSFTGWTKTGTLTIEYTCTNR